METTNQQNTIIQELCNVYCDGWRLLRSARSSFFQLKCYSHFSQPGILVSRTSSRTPSGPLLGPHCTGGTDTVSLSDDRLWKFGS